MEGVDGVSYSWILGAQQGLGGRSQDNEYA